MSITKPSEKSQEAMQAKTQAIPPRVREEVSPLPSGGTEGQVLTMGETEAEWEDLPKELPEGGTAGQVLTVNSGATGVEWAAPKTSDQYVIAFGEITVPAAGTYNNSTPYTSKKLYKNGVLVDSADFYNTIKALPNGTIIGVIEDIDLSASYNYAKYRGYLVKCEWNGGIPYLAGNIILTPVGASSVGVELVVYRFYPGSGSTMSVGRRADFTAPQS